MQPAMQSPQPTVYVRRSPASVHRHRTMVDRDRVPGKSAAGDGGRSAEERNIRSWLTMMRARITSGSATLRSVSRCHRGRMTPELIVVILLLAAVGVLIAARLGLRHIR